MKMKFKKNFPLPVFQLQRNGCLSRFWFNQHRHVNSSFNHSWQYVKRKFTGQWPNHHHSTIQSSNHPIGLFFCSRNNSPKTWSYTETKRQRLAMLDSSMWFLCFFCKYNSFVFLFRTTKLPNTASTRTPTNTALTWPCGDIGTFFTQTNLCDCFCISFYNTNK